MESAFREQLLWAIADGADSDQETGQVVPMDDLLLRYHRHQLDGGEERRLEALLAHNAAARDRLRRLVKPTLSRPPAQLRTQLMSYARSSRQPTSVLVVLAASILLAVLGWQIGGWWQAHPSTSIPVIPRDTAFTLSVDGGIAQYRGTAAAAPGAPQPSPTLVAPDSRLAFTLRPESEETGEFLFGLYRITDDRLLRVDDLVIRQEGGGARLEIDAARLREAGRGDARILLAVGAGRLPKEIRRVRGQAPLETLEQAGLRRAYGQDLEWLPEL